MSLAALPSVHCLDTVPEGLQSFIGAMIIVLLDAEAKGYRATGEVGELLAYMRSVPSIASLLSPSAAVVID